MRQPDRGRAIGTPVLAAATAGTQVTFEQRLQGPAEARCFAVADGDRAASAPPEMLDETVAVPPTSSPATTSARNLTQRLTPSDAADA